MLIRVLFFWRFRLHSKFIQVHDLIQVLDLVGSQTGPLWGGAVSGFDRVRKFLIDGEAVEARRTRTRTRGSKLRGAWFGYRSAPRESYPFPGHETVGSG